MWNNMKNTDGNEYFSQFLMKRREIPDKHTNPKSDLFIIFINKWNF